VFPVYCKKSTRFKQNWRRRYMLKSAPIAITLVWTRHPRPMLCARHQRRVLAAITNALRRTRSTAEDPICGKVWHSHSLDIGALQRYVQKLDIGRVHKFGMERVRKIEIWARSELGIGHDVRRALRTGGIRTWERNRAVKTNRVVYILVISLSYYLFFCNNASYIVCLSFPIFHQL